MKYLIVIALLLVVFWVWRSGRRARRRDDDATRPSAAAAPPRLEMVRCDVCGMHLPETEAVRSNAAYYCSIEHLQQAERH